MKDLEKLSEEEKLRLFDVEELETRLELAEVGWGDDACNNKQCEYPTIAD